MSADQEKQQEALARQLVRAVLTGRREGVWEALKSGADPRVAVQVEVAGKKFETSAYSLLIKRIREYSGSCSELYRDETILENILWFTKIPIPEKDSVFPESSSLSVRKVFNNLQNLQREMVSYRIVADFAGDYPSSSVVQGGKLAFMRQTNPQDRHDASMLVTACSNLLGNSQKLFRILMTDTKVWASSADAANYAEAAAHLLSRFSNHKPRYLPWVNRTLDEDQKATALARYLDKPGSTR